MQSDQVGNEAGVTKSPPSSPSTSDSDSAISSSHPSRPVLRRISQLIIDGRIIDDAVPSPPPPKPPTSNPNLEASSSSTPPATPGFISRLARWRPFIPGMWKEESDSESDPEPEPEIDFVVAGLGRPDLRHQSRSPALADSLTPTPTPAKDIEAVQLDRGMVSLTS